MDWLTSNATCMIERATQFLWAKQTAILDNISNVETPNYKTKYVTFEEALRGRLRTASGNSRPYASIRDALEEARPITHEASTETARMDGNGVNLTEQGVELARNTYQIQYAMNAVNSDLSILRTAIKGT